MANRMYRERPPRITPVRVVDILPLHSSMGSKYIRQRWYQTLGHQCVLWRIDSVLGHI